MLLDAVDDGMKLKEEEICCYGIYLYIFLVNGLAEKKGVKQATTMCS